MKTALQRIFSKSPVLVLLFFCFLFAPKAWANSSFALKVSPSVSYIHVFAPTTLSLPLTLENQSTESENLEVLFKPFTPSNLADGTIVYRPNTFSDENYNNLFQNIHILGNGQEITRVELAPQEKKQISLLVDIPKSIKEADYNFSAVFLSSQVPNSNAKNRVEVRAALASNIILSFGNQTQAAGILEEFSSQNFFEHGPIALKIKLKNTSNHFINPTGDVLITNMFNQPIGKVNIDKIPILANTARYLTNVYQTIPGNINDQPVIVWNHPILIGPYSATATIKLSDNGPVFSRKLTFFVLPKQILLIAVFIALTVVIIFTRIKKKMR